MNLPVISLQPDGSKVKEKVTISPFVLPREDEFSSTAVWKDASGPKNWNQQQGFYFYRNNRMLQAGGWSRLRSVDEHTKLLRVAVDFPSELDRSFSITSQKCAPEFLMKSVKKYRLMSAYGPRLPAPLRQKITRKI